MEFHFRCFFLIMTGEVNIHVFRVIQVVTSKKKWNFKNNKKTQILITFNFIATLFFFHFHFLFVTFEYIILFIRFNARQHSFKTECDFALFCWKYCWSGIQLAADYFKKLIFNTLVFCASLVFPVFSRSTFECKMW